MGITAVQTGSGWDVDGLTEVPMMYDRETGLPSGDSPIPIALASRPVPRAVRAGDSRAYDEFSESADHFFKATYARGVFTQLQSNYGNPFTLVQSAGVSGNKTADVIARWNYTTPGDLFGGRNNVNAPGIGPFLTPGTVLFMELGVNDCSDLAILLSTIYANVRTILGYVRQAGALCVWSTNGAPGSSLGSWGDTMRDRFLAFNAYLKGLELEFADCLIVDDAWKPSVNPTDANGYAISGELVDANVHYGPNGAKARAARIWTKLQARGYTSRDLLPASVSEVYDASTRPNIRNWEPDPLCTGSTTAISGKTGCSGVLPGGGTSTTGFLANACTGGALVTFSVVAHPDGIGNCIQADIDFHSTAGSTVSFYTRKLTIADGTGLKFRGGCDIRVYGMSGTVASGTATQQTLAASHNLRGINTQLFVTDSTGSYGMTAHGTKTSLGNDNSAIGNISIQPLTPAQTCAGAVSDLRQLITVTGNGAGSVRVLIGRFGTLQGDF